MKHITSSDNSLFKTVRKLAESGRERRKAGRTLLDGVHLLEALYAAGLEAGEVLLSETGRENAEIGACLEKLAIRPTAVVADTLFAELSPVATPSGLLAAIDIPRLGPPGDVDFCVVLEDIRDPGNLGSILRSAAAAGADAAWLSLGCADAWAPKVLRGGMGAQFVLSIEERAPIADRLATFSGQVLATTLQAEKSIYDCDLSGPVAFLIGNEGAGLSPMARALATGEVHIPMPGGVESLNAAAAAAICLFERVRQTRTTPPRTR